MDGCRNSCNRNSRTMDPPSIRRKDRISELPDEILSLTLSFLPIREAVRTSLLARSWRYIWRSSAKFRSSISLDFSAMRGSTYRGGNFYLLLQGHRTPNLISYPRAEDKTWELKSETSNFLEWVDRILQLDYSSAIDSFRIRFHLNKDYARLIDHWIKFAIAKKVRNLDVDLSHLYSWDRNHTAEPYYCLYAFPSRLFILETASLIKCLQLKWCFFSPPDLHPFGSLVDLQLQHVVINRKGNFSNFLSNCPKLQNLNLVHCHFNRARLEISNRSVDLKCMKVIECIGLRKVMIDAEKLQYLTTINCRGLWSLAIQADNLVKLEYCGIPVSFSFLNVRKLSTVVIHIYHKNYYRDRTYHLKKLLNDIPNLESAFLSVHSTKELDISRCLSSFANLKRLELMLMCTELLWIFIPLSHAFPCLEKLELHLSGSSDKCERKLQKRPSQHFHLKEIVLTGYTGVVNEIEFMKILLRTCTALEKLTIDYRHKVYYPHRNFYIGGSGDGHGYVSCTGKPKETLQSRFTTEELRMQLGEVLNPDLQLVLL